MREEFKKLGELKDETWTKWYHFFDKYPGDGYKKKMESIPVRAYEKILKSLKKDQEKLEKARDVICTFSNMMDDDEEKACTDASRVGRVRLGEMIKPFDEFFWGSRKYDVIPFLEKLQSGIDPLELLSEFSGLDLERTTALVKMVKTKKHRPELWQWGSIIRNLRIFKRIDVESKINPAPLAKVFDFYTEVDEDVFFDGNRSVMMGNDKGFVKKRQGGLDRKKNIYTCYKT